MWSAMSKIHITSEIGKLKKIILHRPGLELERISPDDLESVLFEDIPWITRMKEEHDAFASLLVKQGAQVLYAEDMLCEILGVPAVAGALVDEVLMHEVHCEEAVRRVLKEYLLSLSPPALCLCLIAGLGTDEVDLAANKLGRHFYGSHSYYFRPLPNFYFMRDPGAMVGEGMVESVMNKPVRQREAVIMRYVHRFHPALSETKTYYDNTVHRMTIEGGDILVLSRDVLMVGCSQRTSAFAIESFAKNLFADSSFTRILVVRLPQTRAFMHLDTVFTMLDQDKFTVYPGIFETLEVVSLTKAKQGALEYHQEKDLKSALENALHIRGVLLIASGGEDPVTAKREQWNDSTNAVALAPGEVVTYNRNEVSNAILEKYGIKVHRIEGGELVRGRGGPRCMSMPVIREDVDA